MGASKGKAVSSTMSFGTWGPIITGFHFLIIPDLFLQISSIVSPKISWWSRPIETKTAISVSRKFVEEDFPPIEHSITAHSTPFSLKNLKATTANTYPKFRGHLISLISSILSKTSFISQVKLLIDILHQFTYIRSHTDDIWGDTNYPTTRPACQRSSADFIVTDPFPLVPATWTILIPSWGLPKHSKTFKMSKIEVFTFMLNSLCTNDSYFS